MMGVFYSEAMLSPNLGVSWASPAGGKQAIVCACMLEDKAA